MRRQFAGGVMLCALQQLIAGLAQLLGQLLQESLGQASVMVQASEESRGWQAAELGGRQRLGAETVGLAAEQAGDAEELAGLDQADDGLVSELQVLAELEQAAVQDINVRGLLTSLEEAAAFGQAQALAGFSAGVPAAETGEGLAYDREAGFAGKGHGIT
jgi:hypothetical protein